MGLGFEKCCLLLWVVVNLGIMGLYIILFLGLGRGKWKPKICEKHIGYFESLITRLEGDR